MLSKKSGKLMAIVNIHILTWRVSINFFEKDVFYGKIKSHKTAEPHSHSRKYVFGKTTVDRGQFEPPTSFRL